MGLPEALVQDNLSCPRGRGTCAERRQTGKSRDRPVNEQAEPRTPNAAIHDQPRENNVFGSELLGLRLVPAATAARLSLLDRAALAFSPSFGRRPLFETSSKPGRLVLLHDGRGSSALPLRWPSFRRLRRGRQKGLLLLLLAPRRRAKGRRRLVHEGLPTLVVDRGCVCRLQQDTRTIHANKQLRCEVQLHGRKQRLQPQQAVDWQLLHRRTGSVHAVQVVGQTAEPMAEGGAGLEARHVPTCNRRRRPRQGALGRLHDDRRARAAVEDVRAKAGGRVERGAGGALDLQGVRQTQQLQREPVAEHIGASAACSLQQQPRLLEHRAGPQEEGMALPAPLCLQVGLLWRGSALQDAPHFQNRLGGPVPGSLRCRGACGGIGLQTRRSRAHHSRGKLRVEAVRGLFAAGGAKHGQTGAHRRGAGRGRPGGEFVFLCSHDGHTLPKCTTAGGGDNCPRRNGTRYAGRRGSPPGRAGALCLLGIDGIRLGAPLGRLRRKRDRGRRLLCGRALHKQRRGLDASDRGLEEQGELAPQKGSLAGVEGDGFRHVDVTERLLLTIKARLRSRNASGLAKIFARVINQTLVYLPKHHPFRHYFWNQRG
mmetsp:Transcript_176708/g.566662  ORF Transcript_176708/g.566662 Transcript_176708/m.566662 type:complete len:597 (-) Transcript_176708:7226-9016(-)